MYFDGKNSLLLETQFKNVDILFIPYLSINIPTMYVNPNCRIHLFTFCSGTIIKISNQKRFALVTVL